MRESYVSIERRLSTTPLCTRHPWIPTVRRTFTFKEHRLTPEAFRLLILLCLLSDPRSGRVLIRRGALADATDTPEKDLGRLLDELVAAEILRVEAPHDYLVLRVRFWPGASPSESTRQPRNGLQSGAQTDVRAAVPSPPSTPPPKTALPAEQKSKYSAPAEAEQGRTEAGRDRGEEGGLGGEEEAWREHFVTDLVTAFDCPQERAAYRTFCARYPRVILTEAFRRVQATPPERLRKGPGALFTYLVKTLNQESKP